MMILLKTNQINQLKLTIIARTQFQKIKFKDFKFHFANRRNTISITKNNFNIFNTHNQPLQTTIQLTSRHHFSSNEINF